MKNISAKECFSPSMGLHRFLNAVKLNLSNVKTFPKNGAFLVVIEKNIRTG